MRENGKEKLKALVDEVIESLRGFGRDKHTPTARIALWNSVFSYFTLSPETDMGQHFVDIIRRHLVKCTDAHRFCFEMDLLLIDLPSQFHRIVSLLPAPYTVAMHIAFRVIHDSVDPSSPDAMEAFVNGIARELPKEQIGHVLQTLRALQQENVNIERAIGRIQVLVSPVSFDLFLEAMPPPMRLRFALKCGRLLPELRLHFNCLDLPFEVLQAIADIEGEEFVEELVPLCDMEL